MALNIGDLIPIGGSGNAVQANVLAGKTFSADSGTDLVGTMANRGYKRVTPSKSTQSFTGGYYSGVSVNPIPTNYYGVGDKIPYNKMKLNGGSLGPLIASSVEFDGITGKTQFDSSGAIYRAHYKSVTKYNQSLKKEWEISIPNEVLIIAVGGTNLYVVDRQGYLAKYTSAGSKVWSGRWGSSESSIAHIAINPSNNDVYISYNRSTYRDTYYHLRTLKADGTSVKTDYSKSIQYGMLASDGQNLYASVKNYDDKYYIVKMNPYTFTWGDKIELTENSGVMLIKDNVMYAHTISNIIETIDITNMTLNPLTIGVKGSIHGLFIDSDYIYIAYEENISKFGLKDFQLLYNFSISPNNAKDVFVKDNYVYVHMYIGSNKYIIKKYRQTQPEYTILS